MMKPSHIRIFFLYSLIKMKLNLTSFPAPPASNFGSGLCRKFEVSIHEVCGETRSPFSFQGKVRHRFTRRHFKWSYTPPKLLKFAQGWKKLLDSPIFLTDRIHASWIKLSINSANVGVKRFWGKCLKSPSSETSQQAKVRWSRPWVEYIPSFKFSHL